MPSIDPTRNSLERLQQSVPMDYQAATVHRTAALADSRLIATVESGGED